MTVTKTSRRKPIVTVDPWGPARTAAETQAESVLLGYLLWDPDEDAEFLLAEITADDLQVGCARVYRTVKSLIARDEPHGPNEVRAELVRRGDWPSDPDVNYGWLERLVQDAQAAREVGLDGLTAALVVRRGHINRRLQLIEESKLLQEHQAPAWRLIADGLCTPNCLILRSPDADGECDCRCGGRYHGALSDAMTLPMVEPEPPAPEPF